MATKKVVKKRRGRPASTNPANKSLGMVRVTQDQIDAYQKKADSENSTLSDWVRKTLDNAAER